MQSTSFEQDLLKNRIILITGASAGIGRLVAKTYARAGATVILLARTIKKLEIVYDEILAAGGSMPAIYPFNLATAKPQDYQDLRDSIDKHFGRLDGLLLNAANLGTLTPLEHYPVEQWYEVLQVNLNAQFLLVQALLPLLKRSTAARIIFTTAEEHKKTKAYWGAYGVSKVAALSLSQILSEELEINTNIRVHTIFPGKVASPLYQRAFPGLHTRDLEDPAHLLPLYLSLMAA